MAEINKDDLFDPNLSAPLEDLEGSLGDVIKKFEEARSAGKRFEDSMDASNKTVDESVSDNKKLADALARIEKLEQDLAKAIKKKNDEQKKSNAGVKDAVGALDTLAPAQAGAVKGFQGMVTAAKAFIATPIGAVIAAISVALGVLFGALRKMEPVLDFFEDLTTKASAALNALLDNADKLATIFGSVLTGQFGKAWQATKELAGAIEEAAENAQILLDRTRELEDAEMRYSVAQADTTNKIKALIAASKNVNLSYEERIKLIDQAAALDNQATNEAIRLTREKAEIELGHLEELKKSQLQARGITQGANEEMGAYITRLIDSGVFSPEDLKATIDAYRAYQQATSETAALQEKFQNMRDAAFEKEQARIEKEAATEQKRLEALKKSEEEAVAGVVKGVEAHKDLAEVYIEVGELEDESIEANKAYAQSQLDAVAAEQQRIGTIASLSNSFGQLASSMKKGTMAQKVFSVAQALMNTYLGASQVISDKTLPTLAKIPAVIGIIALGLKQVASINGVSGFFKGTDNAPEGLAFVGERGAELIQTPSGQLALSPNRATLAYLEKGTKVYPHEKTLAMLAGTGVDTAAGDFQMLALIDKSIRKNGEDVVNAINNSSTKLVEQGSQVYRIMKSKEGNSKYIRLKSLSA